LALIFATVANEKFINIFDSACHKTRDPGHHSHMPDHRLQKGHATTSLLLSPCINISHRFYWQLYDITNYNDRYKTL